MTASKPPAEGTPHDALVRRLKDRKATLEWRIENLRQMCSLAHSESGMCRMELQSVAKELFDLKEKKRIRKAKP